MSFEEHHLKDARAQAESRFTQSQCDKAKPLLDAFEFHILDILTASIQSSMRHFDGRQKKIDKQIAGLEYDLGPDGKEACDDDA